jgi:A/G-specific adenine glycosylase
VNEIVAPLLAWGLPRLRDLPWRATRDRWAVLVCEVMAQQTQVARVVPKWQQFMQRWPTPRDCAQAPLADVLRLWSGLGYPRRCRNLHLAAHAVVERHDGEVPNDLASLLALPGVGPYTARAVLSFADSADVAVVDTNVARVLARVTGTSLSARASQELADATLPKGQAWEWNQVLIDFGAQVCTARNPRCGECVIAGECRTYATFGTSWNADADPARTSALTSKPQARFDGSDRQARGRLLKTLAARGVRVADVANVMQLGDDTRRATRLVQSLERDGLVVVDGEWCRLP